MPELEKPYLQHPLPDNLGCWYLSTECFPIKERAVLVWVKPDEVFLAVYVAFADVFIVDGHSFEPMERANVIAWAYVNCPKEFVKKVYNLIV
jgi:hypothetical protein